MTELAFNGKEFVYNHHLAAPFRSLLPNTGKSVGEPRLDSNPIIHGDKQLAKAPLNLASTSNRTGD